jgi:hypothetical protein
VKNVSDIARAQCDAEAAIDKIASRITVGSEKRDEFRKAQQGACLGEIETLIEAAIAQGLKSCVFECGAMEDGLARAEELALILASPELGYGVIQKRERRIVGLCGAEKDPDLESLVFSLAISW